MVHIDSWSFRWKRVAVAIVLGAVIPIAALMVIVSVYGMVFQTQDGPTPQVFAQRAGAWVGPIGGAICAFVLSWWAGQDAARAGTQGALIGVGLAVVDAVILMGTGATFQPLFLFSNVAKIVAGTLGGNSAHRLATTAT